MTQPSARAVELSTKETPIQERESTYFMALQLPSETKIALAYLNKKYGKDVPAGGPHKAKRVNELKVDRLVPGMHIIVLMRLEEARSPAVTYVNNGGIKEPIYHKAEEFADEVVESEPIEIAKFYRRPTRTEGGLWGNDGELDKDAFFAELATAAIAGGAMIKWKPDQNPGVVKLDYI